MRGQWHMIAGAFVLGALSHSETKTSAIVFLLLFFSLTYLFRKRRLMLFVMFAGFTSGYFIVPHSFPTDPISDMPFQGKISSVKVAQDKIEAVLKESKTSQKVLLVFFRQNNDPNMDKRILKSWKSGASCLVFTSADLPPRATNPGTFDYREYLLKSGIQYQTIIDDESMVQCEGESILAGLSTYRLSLGDRMQQVIPEETRAWLKALALGDTSELPDETIERFRRWNLSHILAISGLHIGLFVGFAFLFMIRSGAVTKEQSGWILLFLLPFYTFLAGGAPSVLRASSMVVVSLILIKMKLKIQMSDIVSLLFLSLLFIKPLYIYHLGFQFSFLVTFSLIFSFKWLAASTTKFFLLLRVSIISQMVILPLQLKHFYEFNPLSIIANLLYVPYFSIVVIPLMFSLLFLLIIYPPLVSLPVKMFEVFHPWMMKVLIYIDEQSLISWVTGEIPIPFILVFYLFLYLMFVCLEQDRLKHGFFAGAGCVLVLVGWSLIPYFSPQGTVTMLDVGQGDSFIIELPYRRGVIMIDAAGADKFSGNQAKVVEQTIVPFLKSKGISRLDALILSHEDHDHIGSVPYLFDHLQIRQIIVSKYFQSPPELVKAMEGSQTRLVREGFNRTIMLGGQPFKVVGPSTDHNESNDNSLIIQTEVGGLGWLFTGDISKAVEEATIEAFPDMKVDVLKVSHHGSKTSTSGDFIEKANPSISLISAGRANRYGHPHAEVLDVLERYDSKQFRTDHHGAVQYHFGKEGGTFQTFLPYTTNKSETNLK
ncbi:DNA internalization-related competence protein ComEC/Rec2 [Thalassobacillus hwangdonensis]|uniref:DNA internalization-related competence protein ComEC/Rec2 n=1 Tax=Thalassobacillus hwangdonensis TaxID=546108 RepID=A0ABW3L1C0_9BACI